MCLLLSLPMSHMIWYPSCPFASYRAPSFVIWAILILPSTKRLIRRYVTYTALSNNCHSPYEGDHPTFTLSLTPFSFTPPLPQGTFVANGTFAVDTGKFTGRSPKDKWIVKQPPSEKNLWWGKVNQPISSKVRQTDYLSTYLPIMLLCPLLGDWLNDWPHLRTHISCHSLSLLCIMMMMKWRQVFDDLYAKCVGHYNTLDKAYVFDGFCGANPASRKKVSWVFSIDLHLPHPPSLLS